MSFRRPRAIVATQISKHPNGEFNLTHPNLIIKESPPGLINLRRELAQPHNSSIAERAAKETTFEGSLATIAEAVGVIVDGLYDVDPVCQMLADKLKERKNLIYMPN